MLKPIIKAVAVTAVTAVTMSAGGAYAADSDTAYVPFVVNVDAVITAVQGSKSVPPLTVTGGVEDTLKLPLGGRPLSIWNKGGAQGPLNALVVTGSRGNITLRLPAQSYQNAEVALYSVNGKRILRGKADVSNAAGGISRRNVAAGVYMLSVKGIDGNVFTSRLTHSGGKLNINVGFGGAGISPEHRLAKRADAATEEWEITVSAVSEGYKDSTYKLTVESGGNELQNITLKEVFTDNRNGKIYKKTTIGTQTWMAENLDHDVEGSVCYDNSPANCAKYGRLYDWNTAMDGASSSSTSPSGVQGVCPVGWHLPSDGEWTALVNYVENAGSCSNCAGTKLKSTSGWNGENGNGTDEYGFSALSGGYPRLTTSAGYSGFWWSATDRYSGSSHWYRQMNYGIENVYRGDIVAYYLFDDVFAYYQFSVRCVQD